MHDESEKKMKIFIRMRGGLGNQMFQYAYAYLLSKKNTNSHIVFDIREYEKYYWPFSVINFNLSTKWVSFSEGKLIYDFSIKRYHLYQKIYSILKGTAPSSIRKKDLKKNYLFSGTYCDLPSITPNKDCYLYGYFQNVDLLNPIRDELCKEFSIDTEKTRKFLKLIQKNPILLSIRVLSEAEERHAYKENKLSDKDYYFNCLKKLDAKKQRQLVIMSNNIPKIKKEYKFENCYKKVVYVEDCNPNEQIEIMKRCKDFIISNSTFSWWGAYLGSYLNKGVVYVPRIWYKNDDIKKTKLFFDEMIVVDEI